MRKKALNRFNLCILLLYSSSCDAMRCDVLHSMKSLRGRQIEEDGLFGFQWNFPISVSRVKAKQNQIDKLVIPHSEGKKLFCHNLQGQAFIFFLFSLLLLPDSHPGSVSGSGCKFITRYGDTSRDALLWLVSVSDADTIHRWRSIG